MGVRCLLVPVLLALRGAVVLPLLAPSREPAFAVLDFAAPVLAVLVFAARVLAVLVLAVLALAVWSSVGADGSAAWAAAASAVTSACASA